MEASQQSRVGCRPNLLLPDDHKLLAQVLVFSGPLKKGCSTRHCPSMSSLILGQDGAFAGLLAASTEGADLRKVFCSSLFVRTCACVCVWVGGWGHAR